MENEGYPKICNNASIIANLDLTGSCKAQYFELLRNFGMSIDSIFFLVFQMLVYQCCNFQAKDSIFPMASHSLTAPF